MAIYLVAHAANLTARFNIVTYLHDPTLTVADKAQYFLGRYVEYLAPTFLAWHGDPNPRHHSGFGGELLWASAILLVAGAAGLFVSFLLRARTLALFEEGVECLRAASKELADVRARVQRLVERDDGSFELTDFRG